jgi:hypothetical protein
MISIGDVFLHCYQNPTPAPAPAAAAAPAAVTEEPAESKKRKQPEESAAHEFEDLSAVVRSVFAKVLFSRIFCHAGCILHLPVVSHLCVFNVAALEQGQHEARLGRCARRRSASTLAEIAER